MVGGPDTTDAEIIAASLDDPSEFGIIFDRHHAAVFRFAARRIGVEDAGDVASEVFLRAFRIRSRYRTQREDSRPWLLGIAVNAVRDAQRTRRRKDRRYLVGRETSNHFGFFEDTDQRVDAQALSVKLNAGLASLSKRDRETFLLHALEGLTYAEIARVLAIPPGTVGSRISRSRAKLLEEIPEYRQIEGEDISSGGGDD